ncbi:MAG TPA: PIG-L deacetylase family protein [Polyangiaceae bacterium]|jgi:LmbE family N-acetylglucosaminyl deacetylase|nr:PIG-L deacetylase family protein [Polyangiaceae bacterium]
MVPVALGAGPAAPLRILCLGAHSDDIEIGCGGTILRLLAERPGSVVHWAVFSASPEREIEARGSARDFLVDAKASTVVVKQFRESFFPAFWTDIKEFFEQTKREFNPDLVLCHHRHDFHQDHRAVAELAWNTFRNHLIFEYEIPKYEGDLGHPNVLVPLPRVVADRKVELILRHFGSQATRTWFRADTFQGLMSIRGVECNAPEARAEAFHVRKMTI